MIFALASHKDTLLSGSYDHTIKLWNLREKFVKTFEWEVDWILVLKVYNDIIFSGSASTIKIWNFEGELLRTLEGHWGWVYSLAVHNDTIISGSMDETIKLWCPMSKEERKRKDAQREKEKARREEEYNRKKEEARREKELRRQKVEKTRKTYEKYSLKKTFKGIRMRYTPSPSTRILLSAAHATGKSNCVPSRGDS